jgi:hypothetical protein
VQLPADRAHDFGQTRLDVHVHVLLCHLPSKIAALDLAGDLLQPRNDDSRLLVADDPHARQPARVRHRSGDVLTPKLTVDVHAGVEHGHGRVQRCRQTSASTHTHGDPFSILGLMIGSRTPASSAANLDKNLR